MHGLCGFIIAMLAVGNLALLLVYARERKLRRLAERESRRELTLGEAIEYRRRRGV